MLICIRWSSAAGGGRHCVCHGRYVTQTRESSCGKFQRVRSWTKVAAHIVLFVNVTLLTLTPNNTILISWLPWHYPSGICSFTSLLNYSNMPVDYSELQHPCDHPGCKRFFKTTAGRTKYIHTVHVSFPQPSPPASPSPPHESDPGDRADEDQLFHGLDKRADEDDNFDSSNEWDQESFGDPTEDSGPARPSSDAPDVDAQFYGPGNKLYRNYHCQLNGMRLDIFSVFSALIPCSCTV